MMPQAAAPCRFHDLLIECFGGGRRLGRCVQSERRCAYDSIAGLEKTRINAATCLGEDRCVMHSEPLHGAARASGAALMKDHRLAHQGVVFAQVGIDFFNCRFGCDQGFHFFTERSG
jgi:hypothetical protein